MVETKDWICAVEWNQVTLADGLWIWKLYLVKKDDKGNPVLTKLIEGTGWTKLSVFWQVWRECRRHGLKFRPWSNTWRSGTIAEKNDG